MGTSARLRALAADVERLEAERERRESAWLDAYIKVLDDADLDALAALTDDTIAGDTERGEFLNGTWERLWNESRGQFSRRLLNRRHLLYPLQIGTSRR